jgi:GNAT superfamily N-acetyltransferase
MAGIADSLIVRAAGDADLPVLTALLAQLREPGTEAPTPSEAAALLARIQGSTHHRIYEDLVVDVSCRGQGIGRRLIEDALARAAARGCYKLALSSNLRRDAAHRFYERLGFERHGYSFAVFLERG